MKLRNEIVKWKFLPMGENSILQFVYEERTGKFKCTENREAPGVELKSFISKFRSFSLLLMPPCSEVTIKMALESYEKVLVVDFGYERLNKLNIPEENKLVISNEDDLRIKLSNFSSYLNQGKAISYIPKRYRRLDQDLCEIIENTLIQTQKEYCSFAANTSLKRWHRNLNALKNFQNSFNAITELPFINGDDVVIVGAGPSLDSTVEMLKEYQQHYYVISTDGALKTLVRNDLIPDIIVSCEDSLLSWQFFREHKDLLSDVLLTAPYNANHYLLSNYKGPVCLTKNIATEDWVNTLTVDLLPQVETGRCVGHYAFNFALALGAGRIIMTGFDLSFKGEVFHPKDMPVPYFHEMDIPVPVTVESVNGELLKTDLSMLTYLKDFEYMIKKSSVEVIDATGGGAKKDGTVIVALDKIDYKTSKAGLEYKLKKVNFSSELRNLNLNSESFKNEILNCFSSYLVQNSDSVSNRVKMEDLASSKLLSELLLEEKQNAQHHKSLLIASAKVNTQDIINMFDLKGVDVSFENSLSDLIRKTRDLSVDHIYCINGDVPPDLLAVENLKCTDLKTINMIESFERNLWLENYECLCSEIVYDFWKSALPPGVKVNSVKSPMKKVC